MEPFIKNNSIVFASGIPYLFKNPKVNDIVVFKDKEGKTLIKRITRNKKDRYFVAGDNKGDSLDSRQLGDISKRQVIGKVIYKL
ncbi:MAG: S26 family signal peptidase [Patescibacteria group bacterium]|nr:S26 family signal peptidase [Patescibacteria group bacterium]